jgi:hypothetical protein
MPVGMYGHCMVRLKDNLFMVMGGVQEPGCPTFVVHNWECFALEDLQKRNHFITYC